MSVKKVKDNPGVFENIHKYFKDRKIVKSQGETIDLLFNDDNHKYAKDKDGNEKRGTYLNRITKRDMLPNDLDWLSDDANLASAQVTHYKTIIYGKIAFSSNGSFREFYIALLEGLNKYTDQSVLSDYPEPRRSALNAAIQLHRHLKNMTLSPESQINDNELFGKNLYSVMYFLKNGRIWQSFSETINGLEKDRIEFDTEVISKFGCSGRPGMYAVYRLADKECPNSIALFEAGELEYYGKGTSSTPDFEKAYQYYKMAVDGNTYNPLAGWSMGYILYYYKNENKELKDAFIPEIDKIPEEYRKILSIDYLKLSFECGCSAAANVLASVVADDSITDAHKEGLLSQEEYLIIGSKNDYVFAKNNLYSLYFQKANRTDNKEEKSLYLKKAYKELKESADLGEPWAINKFALYLYESGECEEAYSYFIKGHRFLNDWCTYNLLDKYYLSDDATKKAFSSFDALDKSDIEKMIQRCLHSSDVKIVDNTKTLLETV